MWMFTLLSSWSSCLLCTHVTLLDIHIYSYVHNEKILMPVCTSISTCIIIDININQPHLFGWPQGMCEHGGRACDIILAQYVYWLVARVPVWWNIYSLLTHLFEVATFIKMNGMHAIDEAPYSWELYRSLCSGSEWSYPRSNSVLPQFFGACSLFYKIRSSVVYFGYCDFQKVPCHKFK